MRIIFVAFLIVVGTASSALGAPAEVPFANGFPVTSRTRIYELSEIKKGDKGVGYTVFKGAKAEPFNFEVLGLVESMLGPGKDVILARLSGKQIEFTGVISGMSGSPVFIDGRLVGAVSFRFGRFPREPIAGITPIRSMLALYGKEVGPKPERFSAILPGGDTLTIDKFRAAAGPLPGWKIPEHPFTEDMRPIETPIAVSGLAPHVLKALDRQLSSSGFNVVAGGGLSTTGFQARDPDQRRVMANEPDSAGRVEAAPIAPASPVAIVLMRGAVNAAALCTVTMVEKGEVYGCGHPFVGAGHVRFPMATASVLNTLASASGSYKQFAAAREVGQIDQDRLTAVAGRLGDVAPMVPVRVVVRRADQPDEKAAVSDVEIVDNEVWLPMMLDSIVNNAISQRLGFELGGTLQIRSKISLGRRTVELKDTFSAPPPTRLGGMASRDVATAASILLGNPLARATLRGIEVHAVVEANVAIAEIRRVTPDRSWVRPGDTLGLTVVLKPYRQPARKMRMRVAIPSSAQGRLKVVVGGGIELDRRDNKASSGRRPDDLDGLIEVLQDRRPSRAVYARAYLPATGIRTNDTVLTSLPPSAQATVLSQRAAGSAVLTEAPGPQAVRAQTDVIVGSAEIAIEVRP
ncbi:MAG: SpoIVB peptidase S55 domain-containing protein [Myxococcota bacterium]